MLGVKRTANTAYLNDTLGMISSGDVNGTVSLHNFQSGISGVKGNASILCENGTVNKHYSSDVAILSKTLNVVGFLMEGNTSTTINLYGATQTVGSPNSQIICTGGNSSAINNGP